MQKISSYLYPNRITLLADLAGFNVEYTNVYQRNLKIYKGVDNVIEFDIKNADQKRLDIAITPVVTSIKLNVMDAGGNSLPNSPYTISPLATTTASATGATIVATSGQAISTTITIPTANITGTFVANSSLTVSSGISGAVIISSVSKDIDSATTTLTVSFAIQTVTAHPGLTLSSTSEPIKGIGTVTIQSADIAGLDPQFLKYSVTAVKNGATIPLYSDTKFGAVGTLELVSNVTSETRDPRVFDTFVGEIDLMGNVMHRSSAIAAKFYEAIPTSTLTFTANVVDGFIGTIYIEGTTDMTISVNSFLNATQIQSHTFSTAYTGSYAFAPITVGTYNYFRVTWKWPDGTYRSYYTNLGPGKVASITVS